MATMAATSISGLTIPPGFSGFSLPIFSGDTARGGRQHLLPLALEVPDQVMALVAEGMLRLPLPRGLRFRLPTHQPLPSIRITHVMGLVESVVRRHAVARLEMPGNPTLGQLVGGRGRQTAARALARLVAGQRLYLEIKDDRRRLILPDTGQVTGWGPYAKGTHAPHSRNPRGTEPSIKPIRPDFRSLFDDEPLRYRIDPAKLVEAPPTETCCWPLEGGMDCGEAVSRQARARGRSYCPNHEMIAYPSTQARRNSSAAR